MPLPPDDPPAAVPEWVVTYGDMMSLLLTFFIMLVSVSEMKKEGELRARLDSIRAAFGADAGAAGVPGTSLQTTSLMRRISSRSAVSEGGTSKAGRNSGGQAGPQRTVQRISHGTALTLGGRCLFAPYDATLPDELQTALDAIAGIVASQPKRIAVRGHATREPLPAGSPYRDPMDLSFARARNAAEYLVSRGIARERILISAAGDAEPRLVSRRPEDQRQNRRVDVFLLDSYTTPPQPREDGDQ